MENTSERKSSAKYEMIKRSTYNSNDEGGTSRTYTIQEAIDFMGFKRFQIGLSIVAGLCWMCESMEMMLLVILAPILQCSWFLSSWQEAILSTLVMGGMTLGSSFWGTLGDKHGRKPILILSCVYCGFYGFLSSLSPSYTWIAINRFFVGLCIGAFPQALTLYSEYLTTKTRGAGLLAIEFCFAIGSAVASLIAKHVVPTLGWRYFLAFTAIPALVFPSVSYWIPESARYYLYSGRYDKAVHVLSTVSKANRTSLPPGQLDRVSEIAERGSIQTLLSGNYRRLTICVISCWFLVGVCYFGLALLIPTLLTHPDKCHGTDIQTVGNQTCSIMCVELKPADYNDLIISSLADSPGVFITVAFLQVMGRKKVLALDCGIYAACLFLSNICLSRSVLIAFLSVARGAVAGAYQTLYVYTSEAYPTHIRALAIGVGSGASRFGAVLTPFLAQVLTQYNAFMSITIYGILSTASLLIAFALPFETKGVAMKEERKESQYTELDKP